jgi:hypothetical protein
VVTYATSLPLPLLQTRDCSPLSLFFSLFRHPTIKRVSCLPLIPSQHPSTTTGTLRPLPALALEKDLCPDTHYPLQVSLTASPNHGPGSLLSTFGLPAAHKNDDPALHCLVQIVPAVPPLSSPAPVPPSTRDLCTVFTGSCIGSALIVDDTLVRLHLETTSTARQEIIERERE